MVPWRQDLRRCATGEAGLVATPGPRSLTDDDGQSYAGQHLQPERPVPRRSAERHPASTLDQPALCPSSPESVTDRVAAGTPGTDRCRHSGPLCGAHRPVGAGQHRQHRLAETLSAILGELPRPVQHQMARVASLGKSQSLYGAVFRIAAATPCAVSGIGPGIVGASVVAQAGYLGGWSCGRQVMRRRAGWRATRRRHDGASRWSSRPAVGLGGTFRRRASDTAFVG